MPELKVEHSECESFLGASTVRDIGMGALFFFASHMVIRTTFYLGDGKSETQMLAFILIVLAAMALAHVFWKPLLGLRLLTTEYISTPLVSLFAGAGAVLALVSVVPDIGNAYFYLSAVFVGLAIGAFSVVLVSTVTPNVPSAHQFRVPWSLIWAVVFYFAFRFASTVSYSVGEGLLLALPLITLACTSLDVIPVDPEAQEEGRRALQVLVWISMGDVAPVESSVNYWTLFEIASVIVILACCFALCRLACQKVLPRGTAVFVACLCVVPAFAVGCATAAAFMPVSNGSLMWESSFWVLIVAIFSYDMRATPYSVDGTGTGIMFEAMCAGQMTVQVVISGTDWPLARLMGVALAVAYLAGVFWQLHDAAETVSAAGGTRGDILQPAGRGCLYPAVPMTDSGLDGPVSHGVCEHLPTNKPSSLSENPASGVSTSRYTSLARRYGLTEREALIFKLVAAGRSANYISETLDISFNTVRTHIRHVYEKLGVHSKQELLDIVNDGAAW